MTLSAHYACISQDEYVRRVHAIADALERTGADLAAAGIAGAAEWRAAAVMVRAAAGDAPEIDARLGMSTIEAMLRYEAAAPTWADGVDD